jgi:hypothetical protein
METLRFKATTSIIHLEATGCLYADRSVTAFFASNIIDDGWDRILDLLRMCLLC